MLVDMGAQKVTMNRIKAPLTRQKEEEKSLFYIFIGINFFYRIFDRF
jgi:hypothetical protein